MNQRAEVRQGISAAEDENAEVLGVMYCNWGVLCYAVTDRESEFYDNNSASCPARDADSTDTGDGLVIRRAACNIMYALVNSNAMNAEVVGYQPPVWYTYMYILDGVVGGIAVLWGALAFLRCAQLKKKLRNAQQ